MSAFTTKVPIKTLDALFPSDTEPYINAAGESKSHSQEVKLKNNEVSKGQ
jgi:hypothetical protein